VAKRLVQDPNVTVIIRQINSRSVFITGRVTHAGKYPLNGSTSVLQLIAMAGGLSNGPTARTCTVMRTEPNGTFATHRFNYKDVLGRKNLDQNIELQAGRHGHRALTQQGVESINGKVHRWNRHLAVVACSTPAFAQTQPFQGPVRSAGGHSLRREPRFDGVGLLASTTRTCRGWGVI
jgi:hypothetical protein